MVLPLFLKGKIDDICLNSGCCNKILLTKWVMQQTFISPLVLEARGSKIKVRADFVPVRSLFLACRWLPSHCVIIRQTEWALVSSSSYKGTTLIMEAPSSRTHLNLITSCSQHPGTECSGHPWPLNRQNPECSCFALMLTSLPVLLLH